MVEQLVLNHGITPALPLTTWLLVEYRLMNATLPVTVTLSQVDNLHASVARLQSSVMLTLGATAVTCHIINTNTY
jgi:carbon starvation protein CstA